MNLNLWILLGAVLALFAFGGGMYTKGRMDGTASCKSKQVTAVINGEKRHDKKTKEITVLPDDSLHRRYCEWVRDDKPACLQADIPVR